jgi:thiol-disulfide isomerase/thioredoxin
MQEHEEPHAAGHHEILPDDHHIHFMEKKAKNLTVAEFDDYIGKHDVVMVDFYAPWCIWCQRLDPVWENTANEVSQKDYAEFVQFARVDCTAKDWAPICRKKKIFAYPSVFLYRDGRSDRHQQYHGARTTAAFVGYIEGLPVETEQNEQLLDEEELVREEIAQEQLAKHHSAKRHEDTVKNLPIDHGINHPLKNLMPSNGAKDHGLKALMSILNILANNGGSRQGGTVRVLRSKNGGTVRIISLRRIPFGGRHGKNNPLSLKKAGGANRPKPIKITTVLKNEKGDANSNIKIKVLPETKPTVKVPETKAPLLQASEKKAPAKAPEKPAAADPKASNDGRKKGRRLLAEEVKTLTVAEMRDLRDEFLESNTDVRQQLWKQKVLTLSEEQQKEFQDMLDKKNNGEKDEPVVEPKTPPKPREKKDLESLENRPAEAHPLYSGHTEGCLVFGAIAAEKVPGNLRFTAKSMWHDFMSHHIDLSHTIHHLSFGDLTHVLQNEFEHVDFHDYEGLKYISALGGKEFVSEGTKMTHHHYTKVVKTRFRLLDKIPKGLKGHELFQYTSTSHQYEDTTHAPSVKVSFDFSPMTLYFKETGTPVYKFLTSVCAIIGGAVTVFSMLNSLLQSLSK